VLAVWYFVKFQSLVRSQYTKNCNAPPSKKTINRGVLGLELICVVILCH